VNFNPVGTTQGIPFILNLFSALADILYIYPDKRKKASFDNKIDEIMRNGLNTALNRGDKKSKLDAGGSSGKTVVGGSSSFLNNEKPEDKYL